MIGLEAITGIHFFFTTYFHLLSLELSLCPHDLHIYVMQLSYFKDLESDYYIFSDYDCCTSPFIQSNWGKE